MKKDTKELIGFPATMLIAILGAYGFIKLIASLPMAKTPEDILGGMLLIGFLGVPLFFGIIIAIIALCMWMSSDSSS